VWFRWLYVSFSRYMWVNEWLEVKVHWPKYMSFYL
jgi:N-acetylglucosaminylphosphatidylinositol deacetylase